MRVKLNVKIKSNMKQKADEDFSPIKPTFYMSPNNFAKKHSILENCSQIDYCSIPVKTKAAGLTEMRADRSLTSMNFFDRESM